MTDRHGGYIVILDKELRDDDAEWVLKALSMIKGVLAVTPVPAQGAESFIVESRMRIQFSERLRELARNITSEISAS